MKILLVLIIVPRVRTLSLRQKIEFPFFQAASEVFGQGQPHYTIFKTDLETSGFFVDVQSYHYPFELKKHSGSICSERVLCRI